MQSEISSIVVRDRVRKDAGDISGLAESMGKYGQLSPILVTPGNELIAGYRRLAAARHLGWEKIEVRVIEHESEIEKLEMELGENVYRKDFTPEELLAGYQRLESLRHPTRWRKLKAFFRKLFGFLPFVRRGKKASDSSADAEWEI